MREPHRSPCTSRHFATRIWLALALCLVPALANAQAPRVLTLEEAGRDVRVDPVLGLMVLRAQVEADTPDAAPAIAPDDETARFANFHPTRLRLETMVSVLIEGTPERARLEERGIVVGTIAGDVVTATLPIALLPELLGVPGVLRVSAASMVEKALNVSAYEIDANVLWGGTPPSYPAGSLTGSNVIVGIVDTGVDPRVADLKDPANRTRFKSIWDQQWSGSPPAGFAYGTEYSEAQINANQLTEYHDLDGHGTHLAGIAAGSGQSTGNGQPAYRYVGIAPRASLIGVKAYMLETQIIDAVNYVFTKATALGKPAVVNLSLSVTNGAHDGTYTFDRALSALTGRGKIITAAAGNKGLENGHARYDLAAGANVDVTFAIPTYTPSISQHEALVIEGWHDPSAAFDVKLISPTGITTAVLTPGTQSGQIVTADGTYIIQNDILTNLLGAKQIMVYVGYGVNGSPRPRSGTWKLNIKRRSGTTTGTAHWWIAQSLFGSTILPAFTGAGIDTAYTVTSPATGDSIISTGSYTTKVAWPNSLGSTSKYPFSPPLFRLSDFTSRGPRRDGVQRPDVVAPGYGVMSTTSTEANISATYKDLDGVHHMGKGTSVANAHTTGSVALLLEQNSQLTPSGARLILRTRARTDAYTGSVPNGKWGYGKLDLSPSSTTGVNDGIALGLSFRNVWPNPSRDDASFEFDVSALALSQGASTPVRVRIVDVRGREVATLKGVAAAGPQRLTWNGRDAAGRPSASGGYFARLQVGETQLQKKFVRTTE